MVGGNSNFKGETPFELEIGLTYGCTVYLFTWLVIGLIVVF